MNPFEKCFANRNINKKKYRFGTIQTANQGEKLKFYFHLSQKLNKEKLKVQYKYIKSVPIVANVFTHRIASFKRHLRPLAVLGHILIPHLQYRLFK